MKSQKSKTFHGRTVDNLLLYIKLQRVRNITVAVASSRQQLNCIRARAIISFNRAFTKILPCRGCTSYQLLYLY
jgi:hypothetical protein